MTLEKILAVPGRVLRFVGDSVVRVDEAIYQKSLQRWLLDSENLSTAQRSYDSLRGKIDPLMADLDLVDRTFLEKGLDELKQVLSGSRRESAHVNLNFSGPKEHIPAIETAFKEELGLNLEHKKTPTSADLVNVFSSKVRGLTARQWTTTSEEDGVWWFFQLVF